MTPITKIFTLLFIAITLCSCASQTSHDPKTFVIGADLPLSGPLAVYGTPILEGASLAVEKINQEGDIQLILAVEDNQGDPKAALSAAQVLVEQKGANAIISTMVGPVGAILPYTESKQIPLVYSAASDASSKTKEFAFRDSVDSYLDCSILAKESVRKGQTKIALFGAEGEFTERCKEAVESQGLELVRFEKYVKGDQDFQTPLAKIAYANPDAVLLSAYSDDCIQIWKKVRELHLSMNFLIPFTQTGCGDERSQKELQSIKNNVQGLRFSPDMNSPIFIQFNQSYHQTYGKDQTLLFFTALAYDWVHYISKAAISCQEDSQDSAQCLKLKLESTNYTGAWGSVTFSEGHYSLRPRLPIVWDGDQWIDSP